MPRPPLNRLAFCLVAVAPAAAPVAAAPVPATGVATAARAPAAVRSPLPHVAEFMLSLCGLSNFSHAASSPCHHHIFGFAIAWNECAYRHPDDMQAFGLCVRGCSTRGGLCARACAGGVASLKTSEDQCIGRCAGAADCVDEALNGTTGVADAAETAGKCFAALQSDSAAAAPAAPLALVSAHRGAAGRHREQPADVTFTSGRCSCDVTGTVKGVHTGQAGCAPHGKEPEAGAELYCFVEGGARCPGARPAATLAGLYWGFCFVASTTTEPAQQESQPPPKSQEENQTRQWSTDAWPFAGAAGCELVERPERQELLHLPAWQPIPELPEPPAPPGEPFSSKELAQLRQEYKEWNTTVKPPDTGAQVDDLFSQEHAQPLPPALLMPPKPFVFTTQKPDLQRQARLRRRAVEQASTGLSPNGIW